MDKLKQKIIEILDETLQVGEGVSFHYYDKDNSAIDQIMTLIAQDRAELISRIRDIQNSYGSEQGVLKFQYHAAENMRYIILGAILTSLEADDQKGQSD